MLSLRRWQFAISVRSVLRSTLHELNSRVVSVQDSKGLAAKNIGATDEEVRVVAADRGTGHDEETAVGAMAGHLDAAFAP